jgi:hypothetical protein
MGRVAPFAFPNTRRASEAMALGTCAPGSQALVATLLFGVPALIETASVTAEGAGSGLVTPQGVALVKVRADGAGQGLVTPQGVALAAVRAEGAGSARVTPQGVALARVVAEGAGYATLRADVSTSAVVRAEGRGWASVQAFTTRGTLLDRLAPRVARIRATTAAGLGDRPYRVYLVTTAWSGGDPGRGSQTRVRTEIGAGTDRRTGLTVPPKQGKTDPRQPYRVDARGSSMAPGTIYLSEIDPALVERDFVNFVDLAQHQESYFEIEPSGRFASGGLGPVRRYRLAAVPEYDSCCMQWVLALSPQEPSRAFGNATGG